MASLATLGRLSGRAGRVGRRSLAPSSSSSSYSTARRDFTTSASSLAAQNFTMPALSPTMTEGNIAAWRVKEGDRFQPGDVLLEIETDKAIMDVEAQEDGLVAKIFMADGAKAIKVGARIAVLAEDGDDLATLEIPLEGDAAPATATGKAEEQQPSSTSSSAAADQEQDQQHQPAGSSTYGGGSAPVQASKAPGAPKQQKYPLLPSVAHLIKSKGLDEAAIAQMTPTGPGGRLLKGDVLAHMGAISPKTPAAISDMFRRLSHLDLANIKLAPKKPAPEQKQHKDAAAAAAAADPPVRVHVSLPVSLDAALHAHRNVHKSLGVNLPLATFIERAADLANDALPFPPAAARAPSADELFDQVLGLGPAVAAQAVSRGRYFPVISSPPTAAAAAAPRLSHPSSRRQAADILDVLAGPPSRPAKKPARTQIPAGLDAAGADAAPLFSLTVPKTEEKRARVFLERIKVVLEKEPARLLL